jgi:hypothetical protein
MSRYVRVQLRVSELSTIAFGLQQLGIAFEHGHDRVMLQGSLECSGDPVDLRVEAGVGGSVEDFGFCLVDAGTQTTVELVCGEIDRHQLERTVLAPLLSAVASETVRRSATQAGLEVSPFIDASGQRRLVLKRR